MALPMVAASWWVILALGGSSCPLWHEYCSRLIWLPSLSLLTSQGHPSLDSASGANPAQDQPLHVPSTVACSWVTPAMKGLSDTIVSNMLSLGQTLAQRQ